MKRGGPVRPCNNDNKGGGTWRKEYDDKISAVKSGILRVTIEFENFTEGTRGAKLSVSQISSFVDAAETKKNSTHQQQRKTNITLLFPLQTQDVWTKIFHALHCLRE